VRALVPPARGLRTRAGITLTEILISIMIMGIGLLSLATLFPLGLIRIRDAQRSSRSALLTESAVADIWGRGLLHKPSFTGTWYGVMVRGAAYDPFLVDPANANAFAGLGSDAGAFRMVGSGLPVCYDPLWWYEVGLNTGGTVNPVTVVGSGSEARFGYGLDAIASDPDGNSPSAWGLQRITNFPPVGSPAYFFPFNPEQVFASHDDVVFQTGGQPNLALGQGNPMVPDMSAGQTLVDLSYTWFFTGQQSDIGNGRVFDGDIVICHNRPFGYDTVAAPLGGTIAKADGETVVQAIWGYGPAIDLTGSSGVGYAVNANTVLLSWPSNMPDPDIRVGGWIADVTYERFATNTTRFSLLYPAQRCHWYRVAKRSDATNVGAMRQMTVTLATPVRARTLLNVSSGTPVHYEAALIMPSVVNVYSKTFVVR
jgi:hypothetical protein